jgi:hypothetical protein
MTMHAVVLRWTGVALMAGSLIALASIPEAGGLAAAAVMWIAAFALFERAKHRPSA